MAFLVKVACLGAVLAVALYGINIYMSGGWCHSKARIDGKTVIITGANTGIGKETALDLARRGGRIIMACRSIERGSAAREYVVKEAGVKEDQVQLMQLDLSSLESIRKFADAYKKKESRLDILINNAGVMYPPESKTKDGFELTFGTNHLGHFLLTNLLLDLLKGSAPSRIVTVSSIGHMFTPMNWDDLMFSKGYSAVNTYSQSKLSNILFTRELAKRMKGTGVTTYSLHPGAIRTDLGRHMSVASIPYLSDLMWAAVYPFTKSSTEGAQTQICCAVDEALASESGQYYSDCAEKEPSVGTTPDEDAARLWEISEKLVGMK